MDGLMFDTEKLWLDSVILTNKNYGYHVSPQLCLELMGTRDDFIDKRFVKEYGKDFDPTLFRKLNREYMLKSIHENGLKKKKGLIELLDYLKANGYRVAIATSSDSQRIDVYFSAAGVSHDYFDFILCGDQINAPKPAPDIYLKCCERLHVKPCEALVLEDSANGIKSAHAAGCPVVWIPDLKQHPADILALTYAILPSLDEVINLLNG